MAERQLVFVQQPTQVRIPNAIVPPVRLEVRVGDHVDPIVLDGEVKLSILSGPPGGQIIGASTARCPNGVATFDDLRFNVPGTYTLIAECDEDKLELAGLDGHSSLMFLDMATGVDEQNNLVCQRTGYVLNPYPLNSELPTLIDSPLGEGTARRFRRDILGHWRGTGSPPGIAEALANGAVIHVLYRQYRVGSRDSAGDVIRFVSSPESHTLIQAGFDPNLPGNPRRQYFRYGRGSIVQRAIDLENWSLISLGGVDGAARYYINGTQGDQDFNSGAYFLSSGVWVGYNLNGDIAQIGIEPVSSLEDMDAKALHAAQMCKVAP